MNTSPERPTSDPPPAGGGIADFVLGCISLMLGITIYVLIPYQVNAEPVPGASQYVTFTPAALPRACAIAFVVIGLLELYFGLAAGFWSQMRLALESASDRALRLLVLGIMLPMYPFVMANVGYFAATAVFLAILIVFGGERRPVTVAIFSMLMPLAIYGLFSSLMSIPLPEGRLLEY